MPASNRLYLNKQTFEAPILDLRVSGNLEGLRREPASWHRCPRIGRLDGDHDAQFVINRFVWGSRI
jgi:hypothetical protein